MEIIKQIIEKIDDELEDAEKYIDCAMKVKSEYPTLADTYHRLSIEEIGHSTLLHNQVVKFIDDYKKDHDEIPPAMKMLYEYLHDRHTKWAYRIKFKQDNYKQS